MQKSSLLLLALLCLALAATFARAADPAPAEVGKRVMLIFDASGSMWGQIEGQPKIAIAKEVMSGLIKDLPSTLEVGLTVYGHRQKGDCNDVEEVIPLSPLNRDRLISTIRAIKPKGKTPIAHSISIVAEKLKGQSGGGTIILVSDGEETCAGDPCKLVAELKQSGMEFALHVVGFDVKGPVSEQLACIAKAGGGTYTEAANAVKLKAALAGILEQTLSENLIVRAVRPAKEKNEKPAALEAVVTVHKDGVKIAENSGPRLGFKLEPGTYDLTVTIPTLNQSQKLEKVAVTTKAKTEKEVVFAVSALAAVAKDSTGKTIEVLLRIFAQGNNDSPVAEGWTGTESPRLFALPPGTFKLVLAEEGTGQQVVIDDVVLAAGQEVIKEVTFSLARLAVVAKDSKGKPLSVHVEVFKTDDGEKKAITSLWTSPEEPSFFELPPGAYDLTVREENSGQQTAIQGLTLAPGAKVVKEVSFAMARIAVNAKDSTGKPLSAHVEIFSLVGEEKTAAADGWTSTDEPAFLEVPAGTYDITVHEESSGQQVELKDVTLAPDAEVVKEVSFAMAKIAVIAKDAAGKPVSAHVEIFKRDGEEKTAVTDGWTSTEEPSFFILPPGTYDLTVRDEDSGQETEVPGVVLEAAATVVKEVSF